MKYELIPVENSAELQRIVNINEYTNIVIDPFIKQSHNAITSNVDFLLPRVCLEQTGRYTEIMEEGKTVEIDRYSHTTCASD